MKSTNFSDFLVPSALHITFTQPISTIGRQIWAIHQLPLPLNVDVTCSCPLKVGLWYVGGENGEGASEVLAPRTIG